MSDIYGRNAGKGGQQAHAELQHSFRVKSRRARTLRPQTQQAQTAVSPAQLSLSLALTSNQLLCFFLPLSVMLCTAAGGCGWRLELVGIMAAVLQNMRWRGGVLLQGVFRPCASEWREVLRRPEGSVPVLQHAALQRQQW